MGVELQVRLANVAMAARIRPALADLLCGRCSNDSVTFAQEALRALEGQAVENEDIAESVVNDLRLLAAGVDERTLRQHAPDIVHALIVSLVYVDYFPSWLARDTLEHGPVTAITLGDGTDGLLCLRLIDESPAFGALAGFDAFTSTEAWQLVDDSGLDDAIDGNPLIATRASLESLWTDVARLAADPDFLVPTPWSPCERTLAERAFASFRELIARALRESSLTLAFAWIR